MVYLEPVKLIVTYGKAKDTMFKVWTNKGEIVKKINTNAITHFGMQLTHNRKMLILGNWAPDVSIYEVELNSKNDTYKSFKDVMCLSGHKKSVRILGISPEAKRAVSYSEDKCLKVWNINVRYKERERT
jgi:WD40 repeat protein